MFQQRNKFLFDVKGAAAVEFALIAIPLLFCIMLIFYIGWVTYLNEALDSATDRIARQIMLGNVQRSSASDLTSFQTAFVCPNLPVAISCADTIVNLYQPNRNVPTSYYSYIKTDGSGLQIPPLNNTSGTFQLGPAGANQYLLIIYPFTMLPPWLAQTLGAQATYKGQPAYLLTSTAIFRNEQY